MNILRQLKVSIIGVVCGLSVNLSAIAQPFPDQTPVGRWQVKFPTTDANADIEVAITADGRVFYIDKVKGQAIEIMTLIEKVSDQATIPDNIKIIDIQAQAKAEAIARQNRRLQTEAQTVLSTIHAAQSEYFAKNNQFATKLEDLGFGAEISSEVFSYKIEPIVPKFIVQALAIFKNQNPDQAKDQSSIFIGISYLNQLPSGINTIASLTCQGKQNSQQLIPKVRFIKIGELIKEIRCPDGFNPVSQ
ncbi:type IV pilin-like G/H family protein [Synechococcus sp. PCC 7502]|uniref:type IV pilin-like G/H family protein n=1 Tax=Synechococcus sp. PCC 7502 TaxID=1173263 RepID=UPI0011817F87|nr:type IV pilin-like G/H family protein [Synechococcus sp. PCC 7502]